MDSTATGTCKVHRSHFPPNILQNHMIHYRKLSSKITFFTPSHNIEALALKASTSFPYLPACAIKKDQVCSLDSENEKTWVHFVGVGGCGLSALAMLAVKQGYEVSGSDIAWNSYMDRLKDHGVCLHVNHSASNIQRDNGLRFPDAIVVSSSIPQDNVEILHAKSLGVPVYKRDSWLGKLTEQYRLLAISGCHGKSTTASMLAYVLKAMGDDLTAVIGAEVPQFPEGNMIYGGGKNFVLEADEYDCCFLGLSPYLAVVTNLDWEHVDIFQDKEAVKKAFRRFVKQIRVGGHLIVCGDSQDELSLVDQNVGINVTTYGLSSTNEWHASSVHPNGQGGSDYILYHRGHQLAEISLKIPGAHNVLNSLAVIASVIELDRHQRSVHESIDLLNSHLRNFVGVSRRFEMIGTIFGCHIYDDYAHHPTEIHATLQAARQMFPFKTLLVILQPHTYSRLAALKDDFATALSGADQVIITEVYASREKNIWNVSGRDLASSISGSPSEYVDSLAAVVDRLQFQILEDPQREIVVLTVGAGDIRKVGLELLQGLQRRLSKQILLSSSHR